MKQLIDLKAVVGQLYLVGCRLLEFFQQFTRKGW